MDSVPNQNELCIKVCDISLSCKQKSSNRLTSRATRSAGTQKSFTQWVTISSCQKKTLYVRAIQGHSANPLMDPQQMTMCKPPDNFSAELHHIACARNRKRNISKALVAGGFSRHVGPQATFFSLMNPVVDKKPDPNVQRYQNITTTTTPS